MTSPLIAFNKYWKVDAVKALLKCCGSKRWAEAMAEARPFPDLNTVLQKAETAWAALSPEDWREAFAHHPRIGDTASLRVKFASTAHWASEEQKGTLGASEATLKELADGNKNYEQRFGHVFLICATGKSASEMLTALQARVGNDAEKELKIAAAEQLKITRLRLEKLFHE